MGETGGDGSGAGKLIGAEEYAATYDQSSEFEAHLTRARQNCCLRFLETFRPATVLEVGCGPRLLLDRLEEGPAGFARWQIVEPARAYADPAARAYAGHANVGVTVGYLEDSTAALLAHAPGGYDAVLLSGLLQETTDPGALLRAAHGLLRPGGHVLASVANANSLHRLLAVEMGLIAAPGTLSDRNRALGQPTVFTPESLRALMQETGFSGFAYDGYMLKLLTNDQMTALVGMVGGGVAEGLDRLGQRLPDHAAEFAWFARRD